MVGLVRAHAMRYDPGVAGEEEVKGGGVETDTLVGFGQRRARLRWTFELPRAWARCPVVHAPV